MVQPLLKSVWRFLKKVKIELPSDPAIPLLGIYLEKTVIQKDACTYIFIAALFTIAKTWKQPKCPSTAEWIKKMWYIYTMEYYTAIKKNEIMPFAATWMDLEIVIPKRSKSERQRQIPYDITYTWNLKYNTNELTYKTETDSQTETRTKPAAEPAGNLTSPRVSSSHKRERHPSLSATAAFLPMIPLDKFCNSQLLAGVPQY